jgi:hypothetical protein
MREYGERRDALPIYYRPIISLFLNWTSPDKVGHSVLRNNTGGISEK